MGDPKDKADPVVEANRVYNETTLAPKVAASLKLLNVPAGISPANAVCAICGWIGVLNHDSFHALFLKVKP